MGAPVAAMSNPDAQLAVQQIVKCKWTLAILAAIRHGEARPAELQRANPGLSHKVLNQRLAKLVRLQVVERQVVVPRPLHVAYRLTAFGAAIGEVVDAIARVQREWDARPQA